jgi:3-hydroxyacyl-[acyl-carrier-protein] dehydratase
MRFELIDRVIEQEPDRLVAVKAVTSAEEYLADHFPGFPVLPGVLMLEAMVQAGQLLVARQFPRVGPLFLSQVRNVRYGQMVRPGQCLQVEVTLRAHENHQWDFAGVGTVEGQVAVQGRFVLQAHSSAGLASATE